MDSFEVVIERLRERHPGLEPFLEGLDGYERGCFPVADAPLRHDLDRFLKWVGTLDTLIAQGKG